MKFSNQKIIPFNNYPNLAARSTLIFKHSTSINMTNKILFSILLFAFAFSQSYGQGLIKSKNNLGKSYVFKLDNNVAVEVYKRNYVADSAKYFTNLVDSFPDSLYFNHHHKLPIGQYIVANATGIYYNLNVQQVSDLVVKSSVVNNRLMVFVYDTLGREITDYKLFNFDNEEIPIDKNFNRPTFDVKSNPNVKFYIKRGESILFYTFYKYNYSYNNYNQRSYKNFSTILPGYFAFNQPEYKIGDSLIFKAFLLKKNGKPYRGKVTLKIYESYNNKVMLDKKLKPLSRGAYSHDMLVPDTFFVDRVYTFYLMNKKGRVLKNKEIRITNYQLKNATYDTRMNSYNYFKGEPIYVNLSCFDANDLPLADTKIKIKLMLSNINSFQGDSAYVPYSYFQSYWTTELFSDPSGNTEIRIPDSLLIDAVTNFRVDVNFINADGENISKSLAFNYNPASKRYYMTQVDDSVHCIFLYNSKITKIPARLIAYNQAKIYEKEITLPYKFKVEEFPTYYSILVDSQNVANLTPRRPNTEFVKFEGRITYDSLILNMANNAGVDVSYKITSGKKIITQGKSNSLTLKLKTKSFKSAHILYSYRWAGEIYTFEQSFHAREKELTVKSNMPKSVFPGQEVVVEVDVADSKGRKVKKANLTAYSINSKMGNIEAPDMPYFGKTKENLYKVENYNPGSFNITKSAQIDTNTLKFIPLRHVAYYDFVYNKNGFSVKTDSIESDRTEFAPYVFNRGNSIPVREIYVDNELVFTRFSYWTNPYSIKIKPGKHNLVLRTEKEFITINEVDFKLGMKTFIGVSQDSVYNIEGVSYVKTDNRYLDEEVPNIANSILYLTGYLTHPFYVIQGEKVFKSQGQSNYPSFIGNTLGPFSTGKIMIINYKLDTLEFFFQPNFYYTVTDSSVVINPNYYDLRPSIRSSSVSYSTSFEGAARAIYFKMPEKKVKPKPQNKVNPYLHDTKPDCKCDYASISMNFLPRRQIQKTFLINLSDTTFSMMRSYLTLNESNMKPGVYRAVFQLPDSSFNISMPFTVRAAGYTLINMRDTAFHKFDSLVMSKFEEIIIAINTPKLTEFNNPPKILNKYNLLKYASKDPQTVFAGTILDTMLSPVYNAVIFMEKEGIYYDGAVTNQDGRFKFTHPTSGKVQLKIYANGKYYNVYDVEVSQGFVNNFKIQLPDLINSYYGGYVNDYNFAGASGTAMMDHVEAAPSASASYNWSNNASLEEVQILSKNTSSFRKITSKELRNRREKDTDENNEYEETADYDGEADFAMDSVITDKQKIDAEDSRYEELKKNPTLNKTRSEFRNYGFFVPNILTNRKGKAVFTAKFPDDITNWETFIPAVDYHKNTGLLQLDVKAYKPLAASIATPNFLIQGDLIKLNGKITNYMSREVEVNSWYKLNNDSTSNGVDTVKNFKTFNKAVSFNEVGKSTINFGLMTKDGYFDAESRKVPVLVNGVEVNKSTSYIAKNSFTLNLPANDSLKSRSVYVTNNQLDVLQKEIDYLKNYGYGCNEQNASKIRALLAEKSIKQALGLPFTGKATIESLIKKLEKTQKDDGSWGWWSRENQTEKWMTIYILDALNMALKAGYNSHSISRATSYLTTNLSSLPTSDRLYAMEVLADFVSAKTLVGHINTIEKQNLSYQDRLRLTRVKQKLLMPYSIKSILETSNRDSYGIFWGEKVLSFQTNIVQTSALAYQILRTDSLTDHSETLEQVRSYFLNNLTVNRNTIERATLLRVITDDIINENSLKQEVKSELKINGKLMPQEYPIALNFSSDKPLEISKSGAILNILVSEKSIIRSSSKTSPNFQIATAIVMKNDTVKNVARGDNFVVRCQVKVDKESNYVMIEIPIPAGAVYVNKRENRMWFESERQYHDDRVVIFASNLHRGIYNFDINLNARFSGTFNVIAPKISLMYFPEIESFGSETLFEISE